MPTGKGENGETEKDRPYKADDFNHAESSETLALIQLEFCSDKLEAILELIRTVAPTVSKGLKDLLVTENGGNEDYDRIKKFLV